MRGEAMRHQWRETGARGVTCERCGLKRMWNRTRKSLTGGAPVVVQYYVFEGRELGELAKTSACPPRRGA